MKSKGQTLIELVIVIGVMGVALVGLALGGTVGIKTARIARERTQARLLMDQKMEEVRRARDEDVQNFFSLGTHLEEEEVFNVIDYTIRTTYEEEIVGQKMKVTVSISWKEGDGTSTLEEVTYLTVWQ